MMHGHTYIKPSLFNFLSDLNSSFLSPNTNLSNSAICPQCTFFIKRGQKLRGEKDVPVWLLTSTRHSRIRVWGILQLAFQYTWQDGHTTGSLAEHNQLVTAVNLPLKVSSVPCVSPSHMMLWTNRTTGINKCSAPGGVEGSNKDPESTGTPNCGDKNI